MIDITGQTLLNQYHVHGLVGRGGMADVYKVWDSKRGTYLALKLLHENLAHDVVFIRRFSREAQTLNKLQHPNIVRYYGLEQEDMLAFMLMDFVEGDTLKTEIFRFREHGFSIPQILEIMKPVCSALYFAHRSDTVHCDVKPANIMINERGSVFVTDFGIARMTDTTTVSLSGAGTPAYMAPEQIQGRKPIPQTDIYALGIVLFEMITGGERPFIGERARFTASTAEKVRWEHTNVPPPSLSIYRPDASPELEQIVFRCLEKEPSNRYDNTMALYNDLASVASVSTGQTTPSDQQGYGTATKIPPSGREPKPPPVRDNHENVKVVRTPVETQSRRRAQMLPSNSFRWLVPALGAVVIVILIIIINPLISNNGPMPPSFPTQAWVTLPPQATVIIPATGSPPIPTTPAPSISPGTYDVGGCMNAALGGSNRINECVTSVSVNQDGAMRFDFSWIALLEPDVEEISILSDQWNKNMHLTDDMGNRYDHIQVGGSASRDVTLTNNERADGWFLFPVAKPGARDFIFHDGDYNVQTPPITLR